MRIDTGDTVCIVMGMNFHRKTTAASVARPTPLSGGATADSPQLAADGGAAANYQRAEPLGPPTTNRMEGAGGPFNRWDCDIAAAERRGDHHLAAGLREARARVNIYLLQRLEPVWVPTNAQRAMLRMQAGAAANGLCTIKAAA